MKTLIINGSPKGKKGNTEIFIQNFIKDIKEEVVIKRIIEEDNEVLANLIKDFDSIIIALPLYVHGMPGCLMRFIEHLNREITNNKSIGFILQYGFPEGFQGEYIERYFESLAEELNMKFLGTLVKPEAAAIYTMPSFLTKKLFNKLKEFGRVYEESSCFDKQIINDLKKPYKIVGLKLKLVRLIKKIGLMDIFWNKFLRNNNAFDKRFDRPFSAE
ncbi:NAD(P)H-dependent oxidoreductase [Mycoplasmatota bacterium]|nr:NAD(P)H-dependent oxidoreductase [Mycoplasmatota bacterium]